MPNTTAVLPASVVEAEAHVLEAILAPVTVLPEVTAIVQSFPVDVSKSSLKVQSGSASTDMAALKVVASFP
jgi:hypothetical protein